MRFDFPWAFLALLLLPLLWWWRASRSGRSAVRFSWTRNAARAGRSLRQRLSFIPLALRMLALVLLIIAIGRPQRGLEQVREVNKGIAIEMVVDRSGSMGAEMVFDGQRMTRLDVVKRVFEDFALGNGGQLEGRPNDLIGMVSFARYADTICPLTLAHGALPQFLQTVRLVTPQERSEDGTAIGDALALAAARLKTAGDVIAKQSPDRTDKYDIKSKIIILLTDGANNAGKRSPSEAAKLAADWGIKVYTIGVGGGDAMMSRNTLFGQFLMQAQGQGVDTATLEGIAQKTGGKSFLAEDAESLEGIYKEIDQLERSEFESIRFMDYQELFLPFALAAFLLVGIESVLNCTVFRKIP